MLSLLAAHALRLCALRCGPQRHSERESRKKRRRGETPILSLSATASSTTSRAATMLIPRRTMISFLCMRACATERVLSWRATCPSPTRMSKDTPPISRTTYRLFTLRTDRTFATHPPPTKNNVCVCLCIEVGWMLTYCMFWSSLLFAHLLTIVSVCSICSLLVPLGFFPALCS